MGICSDCIFKNRKIGESYECEIYSDLKPDQEECKHFIDLSKIGKWTLKSIRKGNSKGYLDRLQKDIYPVTYKNKREIPKDLLVEIKKAYNEKNRGELMEKLLKLDKFPIKDPYVAYFRRSSNSKDAILANPKTVKRITNRLFSKGNFEDMIEGSKRPKEFNRRIGPLFKKWLKKLDYPFLREKDFEDSDTGIVFLNESEKKCKKYCDDKLGCELRKGPDFVAKVKEQHIIAEGKFLTDYGGHQNEQLEGALNFARRNKGDAIRIAILDGVVWLKKDVSQFNSICEPGVTSLSALLLEEYLESYL